MTPEKAKLEIVQLLAAIDASTVTRILDIVNALVRSEAKADALEQVEKDGEI